MRSSKLHGSPQAKVHTSVPEPSPPAPQVLLKSDAPALRLEAATAGSDFWQLQPRGAAGSGVGFSTLLLSSTGDRAQALANAAGGTATLRSLTLDPDLGSTTNGNTWDMQLQQQGSATSTAYNLALSAPTASSSSAPLLKLGNSLQQQAGTSQQLMDTEGIQVHDGTSPSPSPKLLWTLARGGSDLVMQADPTNNADGVVSKCVWGLEGLQGQGRHSLCVRSLRALCIFVFRQHMSCVLLLYYPSKPRSAPCHLAPNVTIKSDQAAWSLRTTAALRAGSCRPVDLALL